MPTEGYLFIFLLASALIFVFFYATRAKHRPSVRLSKIRRPEGETRPPRRTDAESVED
jgi:hypothetical protein